MYDDVGWSMLGCVCGSIFRMVGLDVGENLFLFRWNGLFLWFVKIRMLVMVLKS